jgi:glycosyltransferase involved in cell wall biosynthesis
MIVKNEAHVLARCLASVRPLITHWTIVDTGSSDGTQELVCKELAELPGELHERPWRDFATNRNEAIDVARPHADYILIIDADDVLSVPDGFALPALTADAYKLRVEDAGTTYERTHLFRSDLDYRYVGVLHEVLVSKGQRKEELLEGVVYRRTNEGSRSADPHKFRKDAAVLEAALAAEPDNARYAFYLAQSWRDAGELEKALAAYAKRAQMGGWEEEAWYALLEVAKLSARLERDADSVVGAHLRAFERRPARAEPLAYLAAHLRERGRMAAAYPFARAAAAIPRPGDVLFIDESVYAWRARDELAVAAYWAGSYNEALQLNEELLALPALPLAERERIEKNAAFCRARIRERTSPR